MGELLQTVPDSVLNGTNRKDVVSDLVSKEKSISTYLGNGICIPHTRVKGLKNKYVFAAGRCPNGIKFENLEEYTNTKMLFLLLSGDEANSYFDVLAKLSKVFSIPDTIEKIRSAPDVSAFGNEVLGAFDRSQDSILKLGSFKSESSKINELIAKCAARAVKVAKCASIILQGDVFETLPDFSKYFGDKKIILVSEHANTPIPSGWDTINVRAFSDARFSQLRSAIIVGLTRGILKPKDKLCCLGGLRGSGQIDSVVILDIAAEFSDIFISQKNVLPDGVRPEVIERIIDIATELSVEGREGKPVGCLFVVGKISDLQAHLKQLILNPFHGYAPEDRNILNPFMDETVKEYSLIDGAFIIDGSGIMEAAGALIHTPDFKLQLPGGLGARHAAAYAISLMADCISVVVSSSTGQITLFRKGQMMPITEKRRE